MEISRLISWFRMYGWRHLVGIIFVVISLYPILFVITNSFADFPNLANSKLIPDGFTLKHYESLSGSPLIPYFRWLFNTYKIETSNNSYVKTFVKVTGATSGLTKSVELRLFNNSNT